MKPRSFIRVEEREPYVIEIEDEYTLGDALDEYALASDFAEYEYEIRDTGPKKSPLVIERALFVVFFGVLSDRRRDLVEVR